jgi:magnesium transporter
MTPISDIETLDQMVREAIESGRSDALRPLLAVQHPADIADVIDRLEDEDKILVFRLLAPEQAADVLGETGVDATRELLSQLPTDEVGDLFDRMPSDDVAEILGEDAPEQQQVLLAAMEPQDAAEVRTLLRYPPRSAGRLMVEKFVRLGSDMTAGDVLDNLRHIDPETEVISDLYVFTKDNTLDGVIALRDVVTSPPDRPIAAFLQSQPLTVTPETDQEEVARIVSQYNLAALPVVTDDGRMVGVITVDDVIDVLVEESTEDVLRFGGVEGGATDESYFEVPILRAVRRRVGWLMLLFVTGSITVQVLDVFESQLSTVVALSFFIPLLIGTGGNTGAQTVSTMIRGMALGEVRLRDTWRVIARELTSGIVLGALLGVVAFGLAFVTHGDLRLAAVVGLTVVAICTWSNTIGAVVPLVARKLGLDPALVSAPMITTLVDATGLAIYLLIAKAILGL